MPVEALALASGRLFIGGDMTSVDGERRYGSTSLDARSLTAWAPRQGISGDIATILVTGGRVFMTGLDTFAIANERDQVLGQRLFQHKPRLIDRDDRRRDSPGSRSQGRSLAGRSGRDG